MIIEELGVSTEDDVFMETSASSRILISVQSDLHQKYEACRLHWPLRDKQQSIR